MQVVTELLARKVRNGRLGFMLKPGAWGLAWWLSS